MKILLFTMSATMLMLSACSTAAPVPAATSPLSPDAEEGPPLVSATPVLATAVYTCPMHPQVRQASPGKCPICGMNLVVVESEPEPEHAHAH